jgi:hypothetical protein
MTAVGFSGLTFTVQPIVQNTGTDAVPVWTLNTAGLPAAAIVAGILDPVAGINRTYNPTSVGYVPTAGDAVGKWLPAISAAGLVATVVNDQYWAAVPGVSQSAINKYGVITMNLVAGTSDLVRASSVMQFKLSPNALILVTTGTFA